MGLYNAMFYGGLILAIIFLIVSVILFFVLKIPKAFGVVTGQTQKKAIEEIRSGGSVSKTKKRRSIIGNIQARDIDVSVQDKKSAVLNKTEEQKKVGPDSSNDISVDLAKKAAADAKAMADKGTTKAKEDLENESTEILTYNEMVGRDTSEETTSVLENEQATDVLRAGEEDYEPGSDDETDVLTSDIVGVHAAKTKETEESYDDEATDVLKSSSRPAYDEETTDVLRHPTDEELYDDDLDEEIDKTDVLTADTSGFDQDAIYGTYNPEMTAVLRSDMAPGEDSVHTGPKELPGITFIYSETIVHTDESL